MSPGLEIESSSSGDLDSRLPFGSINRWIKCAYICESSLRRPWTLCGCHLLKIGPCWAHYDSHTANFVYSIFFMFLLNQIFSPLLGSTWLNKERQKKLKVLTWKCWKRMETVSNLSRSGCTTDVKTHKRWGGSSCRMSRGLSAATVRRSLQKK